MGRLVAPSGRRARRRPRSGVAATSPPASRVTHKLVARCAAAARQASTVLEQGRLRRRGPPRILAGRGGAAASAGEPRSARCGNTGVLDLRGAGHACKQSEECRMDAAIGNPFVLARRCSRHIPRPWCQSYRPTSSQCASSPSRRDALRRVLRPVRLYCSTHSINYYHQVGHSAIAGQSFVSSFFSCRLRLRPRCASVPARRAPRCAIFGSSSVTLAAVS